MIGEKEESGFVAVAPKVPALLKAALDDERIVELEPGASVRSILEIFAAERCCAVEELVLIWEGEDGPLAEAIVIGESPGHRRHHVHYAGLVEVTVYYQTDSRRRAFKRHETVEHVLSWAVKAFNVDPSMATEFELALHGQLAELPGGEQIGHLAGHQRDVALDLVRGHISNG